MTAHDALDNPVWSSLTDVHAAFAYGDDRLKLYPTEMAPFAAVPAKSRLDDGVLDAVMGEREFAYFVGTLPSIESERFVVEPHDDILQMVCAALRPARVSVDAEIRTLNASNVDAMLELMARVYPAYFRARTIEMGRYLGIFEADELVAMAGLRMAPAGYREISGVCTDPRYAGRGYAGALVHRLAEDTVADGLTPMLHQDLSNVRARRLYESLGFAERRHVEMMGLRRVL